MTRLSCIVFTLLGAACLPTVGPRVDAGPDEMGFDGGALDAGCSSSLECASGVCQANSCVAPASVCAAAFAGCAGFDDRTAASAMRVIRFPRGNDRYEPACMRVRLGQSVTFEGGEFSLHPMEQACGPLAGAVAASSGQGLTLTLDQALGVFGYFCSLHGTAGGAGMAGAIEVVR